MITMLLHYSPVKEPGLSPECPLMLSDDSDFMVLIRLW